MQYLGVGVPLLIVLGRRETHPVYLSWEDLKLIRFTSLRIFCFLLLTQGLYGNI